MTTETIRTANLNQDAIMGLRDVTGDNRANSLNIEQTNGKYVAVYPFASDTQFNNVTIYPPSPQLDINKPVVLTGFEQIGNLNQPRDAKYDYVRRKIWIADTANHRIFKINEDTQTVDSLIKGLELIPDQLLYPYAIAVNLNTGGIFVRGYTGENAEFDAVFCFNSDISLQASFILSSPTIGSSSSSSSMDSPSSSSSITFSSSSSMFSESSSSSVSFIPVPAIKSPYSIVYDHVRSRVWWVNDSKVYMMDEKNRQIETYDLSDDGFTDTVSIDVELSTGNPLVVAMSLLSEYMLVQMNRDNTKFLASAYVPLVAPPPDDSSSSSSAGTASSSSSSESFSPVPVDARHIKVPLINQKHYNLIPITWIGERGTPKDLGDASKFGFMVESSNSAYMDYTAIINRNNSAVTNGTSAVSTTYVPETEDAKFKHQSVFYVDVITQDDSGVKKVRTHVEPNKYEFEDPDNVFIIPRFSWDNSLRGASNAASLSYDGTFWVGSEDGSVNKIGYSSNGGSLLHSIDMRSYVDNIMFASDNNRMYATTDGNLYLYYVENYVDRDEVSYVNSNTNTDRTSMALYDSNVWSTQTYFGNVVILDKDSLTEICKYTGLDGPFKIVKSEFHQGNIVAGAHILWLIKGDEKTAIYEINDYRIADFDVSPDGKICLLLDGDSYDIIRILDKDGYKFIWNQQIRDETLRYCEYIDAGRFFVLSEISVTGTAYSTFGYVLDTVKKTMSKTDFAESVVTTTTTTAIPFTTKAVEIVFPNGFEQLAIGYNYEIRWVSNKSSSDAIKIELYKGGVFSGLIEAETKNTGFYQWNVSQFLGVDSDYNIKLTWLSPNADPSNCDFCDNNFAVVSEPVATTTTTSTAIEVVPDRSVGIVYDRDTNRIVFALRSGLFGYVNLTNGLTSGAFNIGIPNLSCIAIGNDIIPQVKLQTKARVFVGSDPGLSDRWDSGEVETGLTSMYYGGGNNLNPGETYYVHIQIYSDQTGWSEVEMKQFVMPK